MLTQTPLAAPAGRRDRFTYIWLIAAAALFAFAAGRWTFAPAAWLAPLFLLRFLRGRPVVSGLLLALLARYLVAAAVTLPGTIAIPGVRYYLSVLVVVLAAILPYAADRLLGPRIPGFASTLVFPAAAVSLEYLLSFGPAGTINSLANSQYGDLPLMQLASVTGIWGITFLIAWFASVANWAWEQGFSWRRVCAGAIVYVAVLVAVLLGGTARLALNPVSRSRVDVAGISASRRVVAVASGLLTSATVDALESGTATPAQRAVARAAFIALDDDLLASTAQQAEVGAQIVAWPEASAGGAGVLLQDEQSFLNQAAAVALQHHIYLDLGLGVFLPGSARPPYLLDESALIDPAGRIDWVYEKTHLVPFTEQGLVVTGNGRLPGADTRFGRLDGAICFDQDFPATMREAGREGADILIGNSNDWRAIDPSHAQAATFRAVENGYSLLRPASNGLSLAVDYTGRVAGLADYFGPADRQVLTALLPTHGVRTIYSRVGDVFAWMCLAGLLLLAVIARRPARQVPRQMRD